MNKGNERLQLVDTFLEIAGRVFGSHLKGAILKGSAYRGEFVPGYSDIDIHAFIADEAMVGPRRPAPRYAFGFQEAFGRIEPREFGASACQVFFLSWSGSPWGWPGAHPLPGTYGVLTGAVPPGFAEVSPEDYLRAAPLEIRYWTTFCGDLIEQMIDKPDRCLPDMARLIGGGMKMVPYSVATLATGDPARIWRLSPAEARAISEPLLGKGRLFTRFFEVVRQWPVAPEQARLLLRLASQALQDVADWYAARERSAVTAPTASHCAIDRAS